LTDFALPIIEVGNIEELLDRRPVPEQTPWPLQVMKRVAQIAWCCGKLDGKDRPSISDIVANLEMAYELICRDEYGSVDEPCLWPFVEQIDLPLDSRHSRSSSSVGYHSDLVHYKLTELCSHKFNHVHTLMKGTHYSFCGLVIRNLRCWRRGIDNNH
jgi:hypothetical protein